MRTIIKGAGNHFLNQKHLVPPTTAASATSAWDNFKHKPATSAVCSDEQFSLCAFSEINLTAAGLGQHLDHIEPKSRNPARTFDHGNLVLCAIHSNQLKTLARQDVFGGHARGKRYSSNGFIHPLRSDCRRYFHYASSGYVEPALDLSSSDARKARYTIAVLNLNAPLLVNRRRREIEAFEDALDDLLIANDPDALNDFAETELCPTAGRLRDFHSALRQRLGKRADAIIAGHCPQCL